MDRSNIHKFDTGRNLRIAGSSGGDQVKVGIQGSHSNALPSEVSAARGTTGSAGLLDRDESMESLPPRRPIHNQRPSDFGRYLKGRRLDIITSPGDFGMDTQIGCLMDLSRAEIPPTLVQLLPLFKSMRERIPGATPQQLAAISKACSKLKICRDVLLNACALRAVDIIDRFDFYTALDFGEGLGDLRYLNYPFVEAFTARFETVVFDLDDYEAMQRLTRMLMHMECEDLSLSRTAARNMESVWQQPKSASGRQNSQFPTEEQGIAIMRSLAMRGVVSGPLWRGYVNHLPALGNMDSGMVKDLYQAFQTATDHHEDWAKRQPLDASKCGIPIGGMFDLPEAYLQRGKVEWERGTSNTRDSRLHKDLRNVLVSIGEDVAMDYRCKDGYIRADMMVLSKGIAFSICGPCHYTQNLVPTAETISHQLGLANRFGDVVSLNYYDFDSRTQAGKREHVARAIEQVMIRRKGIEGPAVQDD